MQHYVSFTAGIVMLPSAISSSASCILQLLNEIVCHTHRVIFLWYQQAQIKGW